MDIVSYWQGHEEFYFDDGLTLIFGRYNHKNEHDGGEKALGVHWGDYPQSRGKLTPCVIPATTRGAILSGLLNQAVISGNSKSVRNVMRAIDFFND